MWLLFGLAAIITAFRNVTLWRQGRETKYYRFSSLALTALTVCAFYSDGAARVRVNDWGGLMDTMPYIAPALWLCVAASILINGISLLEKKN